MKISGNYFNVQVEKPKAKEKLRAKGEVKAFNTADIKDTITITGSKEAVSSNFNATLATELRAKVREEKSEAQLAELENKIASGNYVIDAAEIAKKILLRG